MTNAWAIIFVLFHENRTEKLRFQWNFRIKMNFMGMFFAKYGISANILTLQIDTDNHSIIWKNIPTNSIYMNCKLA